jgi:hypothetical protein
MASYLPIPQWFDDEGRPLAAGKIFATIAGTSTPAVTYQDADESAEHTDPIELDASGRANIWLSSSQRYDFSICTSDEEELYELLDIDGAGIISSISSTLSSNLDFNGFNAIFDDNTGLIGPEGTYAIKINTDAAEPDHLIVTSGTSGAGVTLGSGSSATDSDINITPKGAGEINLTGPVVNISGNSSSSAELRLFEDTDNGSHYLSIKPGASIPSNITITLPSDTGTLMVGENNLSEIASAATSRTNLGLGTIATQDSNNVTITGGSISGITDLPVADGGTGASDAAGARNNLGLGTISTQAANNVAITGGSVSGITTLSVAGTSSAGSSIVLAEDTDNGSNTTTIKSADNVGSSYTITLPDAVPAADYNIVEVDDDGISRFRPSGRKLLDSDTTSGASATLDWSAYSSLIGTNIAAVEVLISVTVGTDNVDVNATFLDSGGSDLTPSGYRLLSVDGTTFTNTTTAGKLGIGVGDANEDLFAKLIFNYNAGPRMSGFSNWTNASGTAIMGQVMCSSLSGTPLGMRIAASSGNIVVRLYAYGIFVV